MAKKRYEIDMTQGPLPPMILRFALPLILTSVLQLLYNAADIVVVGRFAKDAVYAQGAVGSTSSLINLLVNLFMGLSVGASIVASRLFGSGDHKGLSEALHTSMTVAAISGVGLAAVGFFGARQMLIWMDNPAGMLDLATLYMKIFFLGMPANLIYNFGSAILRAVGDTKRPLYILSATGVINVLLNMLFVMGLGMSVDGVAWATVIAQVLSAVCVVFLMVRSDGAVHLDWHRLGIHRDKLIAIVRNGLPAGVQGMMFSISNVMIQSAVNSFQEITVTGNSVASNIEGFVYVIMNAFYQAALTITAQCCGARNIKRVRDTLIWCEIMVVAAGLIAGQTAVYFGKELAGIYNSDQQVIEVACQRLVMLAGPYFVCGIMDVLVGSLRGMGLSLLPMAVTVAGVCGLRIIWIHTVFVHHHTLQMLLLSYVVSWLVTETVHAICFAVAYRKRKKEWDAVPTTA